MAIAVKKEDYKDYVEYRIIVSFIGVNGSPRSFNIDVARKKGIGDDQHATINVYATGDIPTAAWPVMTRALVIAESLASGEVDFTGVDEYV